MTKDKIKKALGLCFKDEGCNDCNKCPYFDDNYCARTLQKDALELITEQEKEIERLKEENKRAAISYTEYVLEEDTRFSVLRDNVAKVEQKNKRLCEENIEQYKKLKKQERKTIKQAKIDVLNEAKKCSCCDNFFPDGQWHRYVFVSDIDILIKRVENDK